MKASREKRLIQELLEPVPKFNASFSFSNQCCCKRIVCNRRPNGVSFLTQDVYDHDDNTQNNQQVRNFGEGQHSGTLNARWELNKPI